MINNIYEIHTAIYGLDYRTIRINDLYNHRFYTNRYMFDHQDDPLILIRMEYNKPVKYFML